MQPLNFLDHVAQMVGQLVRRVGVAAFAAGQAMSHMVIAHHGITGLLQCKRHMLVTPHVFAQAMHQQHQRFDIRFGQRPVVDGQAVVVYGVVHDLMVKTVLCCYLAHTVGVLLAVS